MSKTSLLLSTVLLVTLTALPAVAALPPNPSLDADRALVGDPLWGLRPGDPGVLYSRLNTSAAGNASTTKTMTLLLAVEAIEAGDLTLDSPVTMSATALGLNTNHNHGTITAVDGDPLVVGDQLRLEDALHAMIISSAGDVTIAIAETVSGTEAAFVEAMNQRATDLELDKTTFANPYGGDHAHTGDGAPIPFVHETTVSDMAVWFDAGLQHPLFRDVVGFDGTTVFSTVAGDETFMLSKSAAYPGQTGLKGGSNGACGTCLVVSARRVGRELIATYMQGSSGDGTSLLDYGFARTFLPESRGSSPTWGQAVDTDLACVAPGRAVSAVATAAGDAELVVWGPDHDAGTVALLDATDFAQTTPPAPTLPPVINPPAPDPDPDPPGPGGPGDEIGEPFAPAEQVAVTATSDGAAVMAIERSDGIRLLSLGIGTGGTPIPMDSAVVGPGQDPVIHALSRTHIALGFRDQSRTQHIQVWGLDLDTMDLTPAPLDTLVGPKVDEHAISGRGFPAATQQIALADTLINGNVALQTVQVAVDGTMTDLGSVELDGGSLPAVAAVRDPGLYALASRHSGGGNLTIDLVEAPADGPPSFVGDLAGFTSAVGVDGTIAVAEYDRGGLLVATKSDVDTPATTLSTWAVDADGSGYQARRLVEEDAGIGTGELHLCRDGGDRAEGDFVLSARDFFSSEVGVHAWRSGERPVGVVPPVPGRGGDPGVVPPGPDTLVAPDNPSGTSVAISQRTFADGTAPTVVIATAETFPDALGSGALQGLLDAPALLLPAIQSAREAAVPDEVAEELRRLGAREVILLGGEAAVSPAAEAALSVDHQVSRLAGATRIETANAIAESRFPAPEKIFVARAYGDGDPTRGFADAIAAGAWAAAREWPVLLAGPDGLGEEALSYLSAAGPEEVLVIGGVEAVPTIVESQIRDLDLAVSRVGGSTRVETALAMADGRAFAQPAPGGVVLLADGQGADAWAAGFSLAALGGGVGGGVGAPVVLALGDELPASTAQWLAQTAGEGVELVCAASPVACSQARAVLDGI